MFRTIRSAALIGVCMIGLSGCAGKAPPDVAAVTATIQQVQQVTRTICGFVPTAATVANMLSAGNPLVATVTAIADAICAALPPPQQLARRGVRRGAIPVIIEPQTGVEIHGRYVR